MNRAPRDMWQALSHASWEQRLQAVRQARRAWIRPVIVALLALVLLPDAPANVARTVAAKAPTSSGQRSAVHTSFIRTRVMTLSPASDPAASVSPGSLDFGNQAVGTASTAQTITLLNAGPGTLVVSFVTLNYYGANDFTITADGCTGASLAPNTSCTVGVAFAPTYVGFRSTTLTIADNADSGSQNVSLSGTGLGPILSFSSYGLFWTDPNSPHPVGVSTAQQNLTLTNTGNAPLTIQGATITGPNAADFAKATDTCTGASVAPNNTCSIGVTFTPSMSGTSTANLTITDNASGSPQTVPLVGSGIYPGAAVTPDSLDFGNQLAGSSSAAQNVTVASTGTVPLTVKSITIVGANPIDFKETDNCTAAPIAPNDQCIIKVSFVPTAGGPRSASLNVALNTSVGLKSILLTGNGIPLPTATPTITPTATPTITPTATATVRPTATATVRPRATGVICPVHPPALPLSIGLGPHSLVQTTRLPLALGVALPGVTGGGTVPLTIRTAARAQVTIKLKVVITRVTIKGTGAHRKRTTQTVVLYPTTRRGMADARGRFSATVPIAFQPNAPQPATLIVIAKTACSSATRNSRLTILPLTIRLIPGRVVGGGKLTISLHTGAKGQVTVVLRVVTTKVVVTGKGAHRKRVTRTNMRDLLRIRGTADRHGQFMRIIAVGEKPARPEHATIMVTVRMAEGTATGSVGFTILPLRHP